MAEESTPATPQNPILGSFAPAPKADCRIQVRHPSWGPLTYGASLNPKGPTTVLVGTPIACIEDLAGATRRATIGIVTDSGFQQTGAWALGDKKATEAAYAEMERLTDRLLRSVPRQLHGGPQLVMLYAITGGSPFRVSSEKGKQGYLVSESGAESPNANGFLGSIENGVRLGLVREVGRGSWVWA